MEKLFTWILESSGLILTPNSNKDYLPFPVVLITLSIGSSILYDLIKIIFNIN